MKKLLIVTGNAMKYQELASGLSEFFVCEQVKIDEPEIQGTSEEIIKYKIKKAYEKFKCSVLVDDTSVHFESLNGFPGPYAKDFWKCIPSYEAGLRYAGTRIKIINHIGLCKEDGEMVLVDGVIEGDIVKPKNNDIQGREFDIFLQADGTDRPMIEYSVEEKNKFSHRGKAMKNLIALLKK
jgi:non-canonical purine NTP pyrophosphatase (RdgB/HAM1 family)